MFSRLSAALVASTLLAASASSAQTMGVSSAAPTGVSPSELPVRSDRNVALMVETGWNSLAGTGINLVINVMPHLSLDAGAGLGGEGFKLGGRVRYNFLLSNLTPFVGAGFLWGAGVNGVQVDSNDPNSPRLNVAPSSFVQAVTGLDWTTRRGFELLFTVGYARLLNRDNNTYVGGRAPTSEERSSFALASGGGLVASLAVGHAF